MTRATEASVAVRSRGRISDCRMPYGAITIGNAPVVERQRADVAANQLQRLVTGFARAQHRRRAIDADEIDAGARQRQRDAAGAATELQHRPSALRRDAAPERDVAAPERLRVFPVVERRVRVPPLPAFAFHWRVL